METIVGKDGWFCKKDIQGVDVSTEMKLKQRLRWVLPFKYHLVLTREFFLGWNISSVFSYAFAAVIAKWREIVIFLKAAKEAAVKAVDALVDLVVTAMH